MKDFATTWVVLVGTTSLTVYGKVTDVGGTEISVDGCITFVCVDDHGQKKAHGLVLPAPETAEEIRLAELTKTQT